MKDDTYNAFERDIAILHAYFGEQTMPGEEIVIRINSTHDITAYKRSVKSSWVEYLAVLGGFFGLFLGFSLLSCAELLYWAIIPVARSMKSSN